jgi:hypothetical protein
MKNIYIAGKVSGEKTSECLIKFNNQEKALNNLGFTAINPLRIVEDSETIWTEAMRICIRELMTADAVLALPCSKKSKGAQLEIKLCGKVGIPVFTCINSLYENLNK